MQTHTLSCREVIAMPEHRIQRAYLHEEIVALKREHEDVVSITPDPDDDSRYLVITRFCGEQRETRPAS
jgi:hypothetical protein